MRHTTTSHCIRPTTAAQRSRRLTIVGLAALSFAIATAETAAATSDFLLENDTAAAAHEQAGR